MAIDNKKYEALHNKTGSDLEKIKKHFDDGDHNNLLDFPAESAIVYQMQKMQEELDYLRGLISNNRDKSTFPGFGTSNSTALRGDTTTISTSQASAITANTAKTGITTNQAAEIVVNNAKVSRNLVTSSVLGSTAVIKDMLYILDKTLGNCLQIQVDVTDSKGKIKTVSTKLQLT